MKPSPSELVPILRSQTLGLILADLLLWPARERSLSELADRVSTSESTVLRDANRLVRAGYLIERKVGRSRVLRANVEHPLYQSLRDLIAYGYGPLSVLPWALKGIPGIDEAWLIGSWADRFTGQQGHDPNDIDILIVGSADPGRVYEAARDAGRVIGKDVNATTMSSERWRLGDDGFVKTVKERPMTRIELEA